MKVTYQPIYHTQNISCHVSLHINFIVFSSIQDDDQLKELLASMVTYGVGFVHGTPATVEGVYDDWGSGMVV